MSDPVPRRHTREPLEYLKVPVALFRDFEFGQLTLTQQALVLRLRALQAEVGYLPLDLSKEVTRMGGRCARDLEAVSRWFPVNNTGDCRMDADVERARQGMIEYRERRSKAGRAGGKASAAVREKGRREERVWSESGRSLVAARQATVKHVLNGESGETTSYAPREAGERQANVEQTPSPFPSPPPKGGEEGGTTAASAPDGAAAVVPPPEWGQVMRQLAPASRRSTAGRPDDGA